MEKEPIDQEIGEQEAPTVGSEKIPPFSRFERAPKLTTLFWTVYIVIPILGGLVWSGMRNAMKEKDVNYMLIINRMTEERKDDKEEKRLLRLEIRSKDSTIVVLSEIKGSQEAINYLKSKSK